MESFQLKKINGKVQELYDIMSTILPLDSIKEHPFDHFQSMTDRIVLSLNSMIEEARRQRVEILSEIDVSIEYLKGVIAELRLPELSIPDLHNLFMMREYVKNEMDRAIVTRKSVQTKISIVIEDIERIKDCLGLTDVAMREIDMNMDLKTEISGDVVSLSRLEKLEVYREALKDEKERREGSRDKLYKETKNFLVKLSKEDCDVRIDQKIFILEDLHKKYENEVKSRMMRFEGLLKDIRKRERCLDMAAREIEECFSDENMAMVSRYSMFLESEQRRLLDEIYQRHFVVLKDLLDLFGVEMKAYEKVEEDVEEMKKLIEVLEPKKELFMAITSLINKRLELIEKMSEFEKIASDPKRLFKSSFQLLSEEKFRNSAFPNLMKIEETIFQLLDEYEEKFGEFKRNGVGYKEALRSEIENRIVNKTIFISRFDSPSRKRRN